MARQHRYEQIAGAIRRRVEGAEFATDPLLPSEAELGEQYKASRVTIRKALDRLREEGLIAARQGSGWFVNTDLVRQSLGRLGTIEDQLQADGRSSRRKVLDFAFTDAPPRVAEVLGTSDVLRVRRVNTADGAPFALVTVWCPADLASGLSRDDVEARTFAELLPVELTSATQTIRAAVADDRDAELLGLLPGAPVLRCERVTRQADGEAVLASDHIFGAHQTEFVVELASAEPSIGPSGLRLVDEA